MNVKEKLKAIEELLRIEEFSTDFITGYTGTFWDVRHEGKNNIINFLMDTCCVLDSQIQHQGTTIQKLNKKIELLEKYLEIEVKEIPSETKYAKKGE